MTSLMKMPQVKSIKEIIWLLLTFLGVHHYFRWKNRDKVLILMYHGVVKRPLEPFCWTQIKATDLENQLHYLKKRYTVLKLSEVLERWEKRLPLPHYTAVITFDDGYKNNYTIAHPLLRRFELPSTIFLVTGCISNKTLYWSDQLYLGIRNTKEKEIDLKKYGLKIYSLVAARKKQYAFESIVEHLKQIPSNRKDIILEDIIQTLRIDASNSNTDFSLLDWEEIIQMDKEKLIEFGGHSVTHNILSRLNDGEMANEIIESCKAIETHLGKQCLLFAYPNGTKGDFTQRSKDVLRLNGLKCGLSTISGLNSIHEDRYGLKRIGIGTDTSMARFKLLTSGTLEYLKRLKL